MYGFAYYIYNFLFRLDVPKFEVMMRIEYSNNVQVFQILLKKKLARVRKCFNPSKRPTCLVQGILPWLITTSGAFEACNGQWHS